MTVAETQAVTVTKTKIAKQKKNLYFPVEMWDEIAGEAQRLDRSMSWVVQRAWGLARRAIAQIEDERAAIRRLDGVWRLRSSGRRWQ
jgi:uncharacterized small protein (TIGR04563 family)